MKLLSLHLPDSKPRDIGYIRGIDLVKPQDQVLGWRVLVRGPSIFLVAPKGHPQEGGWEVARAQCIQRWDSTDPADYDKVVNWTSEPLTRAPAPEIPEMDRPKVVAR